MRQPSWKVTAAGTCEWSGCGCRCEFASQTRRTPDEWLTADCQTSSMTPPGDGPTGTNRTGRPGWHQSASDDPDAVPGDMRRTIETRGLRGSQRRIQAV